MYHRWKLLKKSKKYKNIKIQINFTFPQQNFKIHQPSLKNFYKLLLSTISKVADQIYSIFNDQREKALYYNNTKSQRTSTIQSFPEPFHKIQNDNIAEYYFPRTHFEGETQIQGRRQGMLEYIYI